MVRSLASLAHPAHASGTLPAPGPGRRTRGAVVGEQGRGATGVDEDDLVARSPAAGGGVAEQAGEPLAAVRAVEDPATVAGGPTDRLVAGGAGDAVILAQPAVVGLDVGGRDQGG